MPGILINPKTKANLKSLASKSPQSVAITGDSGAGKFVIAQELAAMLLGLPADAVASYPFLHVLSRPEGKQDISIAQVRELAETLRLRTPGKATIRRIVIIENAQFLSLSAQNSLLKILEEPPADTVFILTVPHMNLLLPTIASRVQAFAIQPVSEQLSRKYFNNSSDAAIRSAWALSQGSAGLINALLSDTSHPLKTSVNKFKQLLKMSRLDRLVELDKLEKDKPALDELLDAGNRIITALYDDVIAKGKDEQAARLLEARKQILGLRSMLQANVSPRLIILDLALSLPI